MAEPQPRRDLARVVLASASPRRRDLLERIGMRCSVRAADIDESQLRAEQPQAYVLRLAIAKACAIVAVPADVVIAADTTVDLDGSILAKPVDQADARRMLQRLSGRTHRVHTGLAVRHDGKTVADVATTVVTMRTINDSVIDWYVGTGEAMGKAGAYAIQGEAVVMVDSVYGSITNVIGLPIALLERLLADLGLSMAADIAPR